ncbi:hypothetical protein N0V90_007621 [Kalmusia sp. IMI 367209]|nr:hypothetical protein N0V90_007621 [Kalmusia sp. IMI 367209]
MRASSSLIALSLALSATAHPHHELSSRELASHQAINKRCAAKAGAFTQERKKRSLRKRSLGASIIPRDTSVNITTESPHYSTIQNDTCILVPEVTAGPYVWPRSETLRQDMREGQAGIPLYLDIGVLDVNTCDPAPNVLIDMWHCFYVERTIHIHVQAHTDWVVRGNGTISASNIRSTGQIFFDEELSQQIMALPPYAQHTEIERTTNDVDSIYSGETGTGWNPVVQVEPLDGVNVENGMIGYITFGVNLTATSGQGGGMGGGPPSGTASSDVAAPTGTA